LEQVGRNVSIQIGLAATGSQHPFKKPDGNEATATFKAA
jgi:hypothetical protein